MGGKIYAELYEFVVKGLTERFYGTSKGKLVFIIGAGGAKAWVWGGFTASNPQKPAC